MVHVPLMFVRMAWISFGALPCSGKKLDSSRLDVVEIARVALHASFQPLQQENTCNSAREQIPLPNDTIDSVLRHREVGRAKDLSAPPRTSSAILPNWYHVSSDLRSISVWFEVEFVTANTAPVFLSVGPVGDKKPGTVTLMFEDRSVSENISTIYYLWCTLHRK